MNKNLFDKKNVTSFTQNNDLLQNDELFEEFVEEDLYNEEDDKDEDFK